MASRYETAWESFWSDLPETAGEAIWDTDPERTAAMHLPLFEPYFDPALPLLDLGCGNGTQTRFLAGRSARVIGVDVSASALALARKANPAPNIAYQQMDLLDSAATAALHQAVGDANIYMRGVVHQLGPRDWPAAASGLAMLTGQRGHLFDLELAPVEQSLPRAGDLPPNLARVFQHGITPAGLGPGDLQALLVNAGFEILDSGEITDPSTQPLPDGSHTSHYMQYVVARVRPGI
ncbi:MAG: class I SAM-dependent methyltransferase [Egibacteraceae bacterium]